VFDQIVIYFKFELFVWCGFGMVGCGESKGESRERVSIEPYLDKFQQMKRRRMRFIIQELEKRGGEAPLKEFMGSIATEYGISYETQRKYLSEFEDYGLIEISGGKIRLKSKEGSGAIPTT
jgi:predicted transcriptional regulator